MIRHLLAATAVGAALLVTATAGNAAGAAQIKDAIGDGNAINGQGYTTAVPEQTTPFWFTHLDIDSVTWATDRPGKQATTMSVKTLLTGQPTATGSGCKGCGGFYEVQWSLGTCNFDVIYAVDSEDLQPTAQADACVRGKPVSRPVKVIVSASSITWMLPLRDFKDAGLTAGAVLTALHAHTAMEQAPGVAAPIVDFAQSSVSYRIGS